MQVTVQNVPVYLIDEGAGTPTLFLHGNPDSADMWRGVIDRLRDSFRCLAVDLPGFGRSGTPRDFDGSLASMSRWVDDVVRAIGIDEPLNIVGHDFGGQFAPAWAIEHPDKVRRLVISNTNFFSDYTWHPVARLLRTPVIGEIVMALTNPTSLGSALRKDAPRLPEEHIRQTTAIYGASAKRMALKLYRAGDPKNFTGWEDRLRELTARVPTCVLWGDKDPYASPSLADRFGAREVHHFAEYSHWVVAENAAGVAEKLRAFLA
jgi:pimeloyl-ACP methyl ester carboxylesterase